MRERSAWIDAARGTALALVVFLHTCALLGLEGFHVSSLGTHANLILDGLRMPTLVMISGLLATKIRTWPWRDVLRRRVGPLALMYVSWSLVVLICLAILRDRGLVDGVIGAFPWVFVRPYLGEWYLLALPIYIAAARALARVPTAVLVPIAAVLSVVSFAIWPAHGVAHSAQWWLLVTEHWVFFVCAERFAPLYLRAASDARAWKALASTSAFVLFGVAGVAVGALASVGSWVAALPALALAALGTVVALNLFPLVGSWRSLAWARAIGRESLGVYASHLVIATVLVLALRPVYRGHYWRGEGVGIPALIVVATLALAFALTRALRRWLPVPLLKPWWNMSAAPLEQRRASAQAQ